MGKKSRSGSGIRIRDEHFGSHFRELRHIFFRLKYLNSLIRIRDPGIFLTLDPGIFVTLDPAAGIRDGKNSDPGETSRIRNTGEMTAKQRVLNDLQKASISY